MSAIVSIPNGKPGVEYREVVDCPGYAIGLDCSFWSRWLRKTGLLSEQWHRRKPTLNDGYFTIRLRCSDGKRVGKKIHALLLEAFVGPCPPGMECRHLNDVRTDNRLENLVWGTKKQNAEDRTVNGIELRGEEKPCAKLTADQVLSMREERANGATLTELRLKYGLATSRISNICTGKKWRHVGGPRTTICRGGGARDLTDSEKLEVKALYRAGKSKHQISRMFHKRTRTISKIIDDDL